MISLVLLWHLHQPEYADPATGRYVLPWTRLHAVKDYDELAVVLGEHPDMHVTVNLTPVLCDQIDALAAGTRDVYWAISEKPASDLTEAEREFLLANFFKANFETMIRPYERYAELYFERGRTPTPARLREAARTFGPQKFLDLQVWANLAWSSETLRTEDPVIRELMTKGMHYTEEDKAALLGVHHRILRGVLDKYRKLQEAGIIEISTTPYYHPILPLLLDMHDAQAAHPSRVLPRDTRPLEEDARWHVEAALTYAERRLGRRPVGMWPAEGSVSEKALSLLASCGVTWAATDELILKKSLGQPGRTNGGAAPSLFRFESPGGPVHLFFRDHDLSDKIGFTYAAQSPETAAEDFVRRVTAAAGGSPSVVSVILDGENAWEYFRTGSCRTFLTSLFSAVEKADGVWPQSCAECIASDPPLQTLPRVVPGSWINGNFNIWIGHPEDNAGWDAVQKVRDVVDRMTAGPSKDRARRLLRIAEGSDWYWWFGDDHASEDDPMFDSLFRENLAAVCKLAGVPPPPELRSPIKTVAAARPAKVPTEIFTPTIDGQIRPFYEWLGAGFADTGFMAGAMHKVVYHLERVYWGFDAKAMYLCVKSLALPAEAIVRIFFRTESDEMEAIFPLARLSESSLTRGRVESPLQAAYGEVLEAAVPFKALGVVVGSPVSISVGVTAQGVELERWPSGSHLEVVVPDDAFFSAQWMV